MNSCRSMLMDLCGRLDGTMLRAPNYAVHKTPNGMMPSTISNSLFLTICLMQISCSHQLSIKTLLTNHGDSETSKCPTYHAPLSVEFAHLQTQNNVSSGLKSTCHGSEILSLSRIGL